MTGSVLISNNQGVSHPVAADDFCYPHSTLADDLMLMSGDLTPRGADRRRVEWLFEKCYSAGCKGNF